MTEFVQLKGHSGVKLTEAEAMALANLCKRITFGAVMEFASNEDEAYKMLDALYTVQMSLAIEGFAPR